VSLAVVPNKGFLENLEDLLVDKRPPTAPNAEGGKELS